MTGSNTNPKVEYCDSDGCDKKFPLSALAECTHCSRYYCKECVANDELCECCALVEC